MPEGRGWGRGRENRRRWRGRGSRGQRRKGDGTKLGWGKDHRGRRCHCIEVRRGRRGLGRRDSDLSNQLDTSRSQPALHDRYHGGPGRIAGSHNLGVHDGLGDEPRVVNQGCDGRRLHCLGEGGHRVVKENGVKPLGGRFRRHLSPFDEKNVAGCRRRTRAHAVLRSHGAGVGHVHEQALDERGGGAGRGNHLRGFHAVGGGAVDEVGGDGAAAI